MPAAPSRRYVPEPVWVSRRQFVTAAIPPEALRWLMDPASLTQRIINACSGQFRVKVLSQGWMRPMINEARRLGMAPSGRALVRQVQLLCDEVPWVYARTVIPRRTLTGAERRLAHLKSRSLGAMLFADPTMHRSELELCHVTARDKLHALLAASLPQEPAALWGRRSVFTLHGKPLLVSEIFLPQILRKQPL
jgi:chorismate--pyruvate lyase